MFTLPATTLRHSALTNIHTTPIGHTRVFPGLGLAGTVTRVRRINRAYYMVAICGNKSAFRTSAIGAKPFATVWQDEDGQWVVEYPAPAEVAAISGHHMVEADRCHSLDGAIGSATLVVADLFTQK